MHTFDRYLTRLFVKVLLICLVSITGLYIVIDACNNLDELLRFSRGQGGFLQVLVDYYGALVPWFFDRTSGLLVLIAAMFAVTWLQKTNEMTALMAAGVSKGRIVRPLVIVAALVSLGAAVNRETVIPGLREQLLRNAQDLIGDRAKPVEPVTDNETDILLNGRNTFAAEQRIERPSFRLYRRWGGFGRQLVAADAVYQPETPERPGGYLLRGVEKPENLAELQSVQVEGRPILLAPSDTAWLEDGECFVVSRIRFDQLAGGSQWRQMASTGELIRGLRNPSLRIGLDTRVTVHSRIVQPFLDMTLFFWGLPLVMTKENRNVFWAAGWCLLMVVVFFTVVIAFQALGNSGYLVSPALAAWAPLMLFVPVATAAASPIWD